MSAVRLVLAAALLLGACAPMPAEQIHLSRSLLTAETERFTRRDQSQFNAADTVNLIVILQWSDTHRSAGEHDVQWRWYRSDSDYLTVDQKLVLFATPYDLYGQIPAAALGPGPHKVEVRLDERLIETRTFEILP